MRCPLCSKRIWSTSGGIEHFLTHAGEAGAVLKGHIEVEFIAPVEPKEAESDGPRH